MSCVGNQIDAETSVFRAAIPYAVGTLTVAGVGIAVAFTASSSTALLVAGISAVTFGSYAFLVLLIQVSLRTTQESLMQTYGKGWLQALLLVSLI